MTINLAIRASFKTLCRFFQQTSSSSSSATAAPSTSARRSLFASKPRDDLSQCPICGRGFAEDRIAKHREICEKTSKKKRKTYDMSKKRAEGTELEQFARKQPRGARNKVSAL